MNTIDERTERGITLASTMLGEEFGKQMRSQIQSGEFGSDLARFGMAHPYTDCWAREGLDRRSRSLLTIGALIALRQPKELKNHIKAGISNGLTIKEIEEAMIHLATYVGYPIIATAFSTIIEALREQGLLVGVKTSEERGVL